MAFYLFTVDDIDVLSRNLEIISKKQKTMYRPLLSQKDVNSAEIF